MAEHFVHAGVVRRNNHASFRKRRPPYLRLVHPEPQDA
jgi:hypothetical protein